MNGQVGIGEIEGKVQDGVGKDDLRSTTRREQRREVGCRSSTGDR